MAFTSVQNVAIRGIAACVPKYTEENISLPFYTGEDAIRVMNSTGIERRHVCRHVDSNNKSVITAADLCYHAASLLLDQLGWDKDSIDLLAFCTQNPDYLNHPNSFIVHDNLSLSENTMCIDFYHGCPGWVVSMSSVCAMVKNGYIKRALLLDGDTVSMDQDLNNREERPLFGDAGTATAIELDLNASPMFFNVGTKSDDGRALIHLNGGYRNPFTLDSLKIELARKNGQLNPNDNNSKMDSMDVFSFAIAKVPKAIKKLCIEFNLDINEIDNFVLHQANKLIIENISKRVKVPMDKVPMSLKNYGNTTSASIPLTLVSECQHKLVSNKQCNLVCGFGIGLSWGASYFETNKIICPDIIEI